MGTTDANGIYFYDDTDGAPTPPVLNVGQQSVSDAIGGLYTVRVVANLAERTALATAYAPTATKPLYVHQRDTNFIGYTYDGVTWKPLIPPTTRFQVTLPLWTSLLYITQETIPSGYKMTMQGRLTRASGTFTIGNDWIGIGTVAIPATMKPNVSIPDIVTQGVKVNTAPIVMNISAAGVVSIRCPGGTFFWGVGDFFDVQNAVWFRDA